MIRLAILVLAVILGSVNLCEAVYFTIENTGQYPLQWVTLSIDADGAEDYYVTTERDAVAPPGTSHFVLDNYIPPLPTGAIYTSPTIPGLPPSAFRIVGYALATWYTPYSGHTVDGSTPHSLSPTEFIVGYYPTGYDLSAKVTFHDGEPPSSNPVHVPVMNGWWLLPGMFAGVAFLSRRHKR